MLVPTRARLSILGASPARSGEVGSSGARARLDAVTGLGAVACLSCLVLATGAGCVSASEARSRALDDADVLETELDTLFECAGASVQEAGLSVARSDGASRVLQTDWVADGDERWRMTVLVQVSDRFGPGANAYVTRQVRQPSGLEVSGLEVPAAPGPQVSPTDAGQGEAEVTESEWVSAASRPSDGGVARATTGAIGACWSERSALAR